MNMKENCKKNLSKLNIVKSENEIKNHGRGLISR